MYLFVLSGIAMLGASSVSTVPGAVVHRADISHTTLTAPVSATYRHSLDIQSKDVTTRLPTKQDVQQCLWKAEVVLDRDVHDSQGRAVTALARPIHRSAPVSGVEFGSCDAAKDRIASSAARKAEAASGQAVAVAQGDHPALLSEIDGMATMFSKQGG
jgi:hypothetical protein